MLDHKQKKYTTVADMAKAPYGWFKRSSASLLWLHLEPQSSQLWECGEWEVLEEDGSMARYIKLVVSGQYKSPAYIHCDVSIQEMKGVKLLLCKVYAGSIFWEVIGTIFEDIIDNSDSHRTKCSAPWVAYVLHSLWHL